MKNTTLIPVTFFSLLTLLACNFNPLEPVKWDPEILSPIAYSDLGIKDLISDSSLTKTNSDGSLSVIYKDTLNNTRAFDLVEIPDTTIIRRFDLSTFTLADQVIEQKITLAQLARQLSAQGNPIGSFILVNHGNSLPSLPAQTGLTTGEIQVDASDLFEFASLSQGVMSIEVKNELPVDLQNLFLSLKNTNIPGFDTEVFFFAVPSGSSQNTVRDLSNRKIESNLSANLTNLDIQGSTNPIPIDTNDFVSITITASRMKATSATAIFPDQTVAEDTEEIVYDFGNDFQDVELSKAILSSGKIKAVINSTLGDSVRISYELSNLYRNGESPRITRIIPPAPDSGNSQIVEIFDLSDYEMALDETGGSNTLVQNYKVDLVYSGNLVNIDLQDSVYASFELLDVEPAYIEGYFGQQTVNTAGESEITVFEKAEISGLDLQEAKASIQIDNTIGLDLDIGVNAIITSLKEQGIAEQLSSRVFSSPIPVPGVDINTPDKTSTVFLDLTEDNSNILDMLNMTPDHASYDMDIAYNPTGPTSLNFATEGSRVVSTIDLEIPLFASVSQVFMMDTVDLSLDIGDLSNIEGGTLQLLIENEYPLEANISMTLLNDFNLPVETIFVDNVIVPATLGSNGIMTSAGNSTLSKELDKTTISTVLNQATKMAIRYTLKTGSEPVKLYENYRLKAKLVAKFIYSL